ncbi:MAG TPA: ABC transporter permease, partial [Rhodanobacteraceae bacterium]|nr:ABC transporter permease [Rhodanobacteraceae bacterium]
MNIWLAEIWRSWRASFRRPGFLLLATCVLGLGVGASAAVFALVDHVLLQPLPFPHASQLVVAGLDMGSGEPIVSSRQYRHLQSLHGVESIGLLDNGSSSVNVLGAGMPQRATVLRVDRYLLSTLGVHLMLGRNFTAQEDRPHGPPAAILGHGFWERNYGGDTGVIGKQMMVKGASHTIVGVLPARFDGFCRRYLRGCDIVLPAALSTNGSDATIGFLAIARMQPGATVRSLGAEVRARVHQLYASATDETSQWMNSQQFGTTNLSTALHARSRTVLVLFMASALFVLLIAWVNLTNLLFLRTLSRQRDVAIREALGALGLHRHLPVFAESLLVGVFGGLLGVGLAAVGLAVFRHFVPASWMVGGGPSIGAAVWVFALVSAVAVALVATWLGLWKGRHADTAAALHEDGRSGPDPRAGYLGRALVVVQVALATVLLAGAGL